MTKVLVTGAGGYIGSHACLSLLEAGYEVVAFDNFSRSKPESLARVSKLSGKGFPVIVGDIREPQHLDNVFSAHDIGYVMHFAGLKAVGESVEKPGLYYDVNVAGTRLLADTAIERGVKGLVFSSSATVYGEPEGGKADENAPTGPANPYGHSKLMAEQILSDMAAMSDGFEVGLLRYFNPVGAHVSGQIGEDPVGVPNNLLPFVAQVAVGMREKVSVFGNDYPTPDGTGVRDYIHVVDLVDGHVKAIKAMENGVKSFTVNLGTGRGYSVLEVLNAFSEASGKQVPYEIVGRRPGDVATNVAIADKARDLLGWEAKLDMSAMCRDHWAWQTANPKGYEE